MLSTVRLSPFPRSILFGVLLVLSACAMVERSSSESVSGGQICGDGRREVNVRDVALRYDRLGFEISVGWMEVAVRLGIRPEQMQKVEETTQNWNEFIKGVALAHNGCSGEKDRFTKLLARYDQLKRAKEAIETLIGKVSVEGKISSELQNSLNSAFEKYFQLLSSPV